jgi:predicted nucleic acid-binding Zn ribbon protein
LQELQDEDDDSVDEPEFHGESTESAEDDDAETIPCPHCGKPIHEEAQRCPHCRDYVSEDHAPNRRSLWIVTGVVICLIIVLIDWIVHF